MLKCPKCHTPCSGLTTTTSEVLEVRNKDKTPYLRRRRKCKECGSVFPTREYEVNELLTIMSSVNDEEIDLDANQTRLAGIVNDIEQDLIELLEWSKQIDKNRKNLDKHNNKSKKEGSDVN